MVEIGNISKSFRKWLKRSAHAKVCSGQKSKTFADSIATDFQILYYLQLAQEKFVENFMDWLSMAEQLHPNLTSSAMQSVTRKGMNHASLSDNLSGFGGYQENSTCLYSTVSSK